MRFLYYQVFVIPVLSFCIKSIASENTETHDPEVERTAAVSQSTAPPDAGDNELAQHWPLVEPSGLDEEKYNTHPHLLTRLIKTLDFGFNPVILKDVHVDPAEKRRKPVTLVGLRKNGRFPRHHVSLVDTPNALSKEVAEMQSPFNDISLFWYDNPHI